MNLRQCTTKRCIVHHTVLEKVCTYIDPRAHLVQWELRYSIETRVYDSALVQFVNKWQRHVLKNTEMLRIFEELNP